MLRILLMSVIFASFFTNSALTHYAFDCTRHGNATTLSVLPGLGWDNLRNLEMLNVFEFDFSKCLLSLDGNYLIPDNVEIIPKMASSMETFSEVIEHYENYRSFRSTSINVGGSGSFFGVSFGGSFSSEHQTIRTQQINTGSITSRVQARQVLFTVLAGQGMKLHHTFRDRLLDIAFQLDASKTQIAAYLADVLVLHFGTHVVTRVDAGGIIWMTDAIRTLHRKLSSSERSAISASASVGFGSVFGLSASFKQVTEYTDVKGYERNLTARKMGSYGGMPVRPGENITDWAKSLARNLVAIDVDGDPIYSVISNLYLGETLPYELIGKVRQCVKAAVMRYYKANAVVGCMRPGSKNFDPKANIPRDDCEIEKSNYTMGGFFQRCSGPGDLCNGHSVANIMTGSFACPPEYREVFLQSRQFSSSRRCSGSWFWKHCHTDTASYSLYWCAATKMQMRPQSGFLFGGIYTKTTVNPVTGGHSCPPSFLASSYGAGDISVCLSRDFELSRDYTMDFGGFFSCHSGNPYNVLPKQIYKLMKKKELPVVTVRSSLHAAGPSSWPKRCPSGYTQHMGFIDSGCEMMFCMKGHLFIEAEVQEAKRPPFIKLPPHKLPKPRLNKKLYLEAGEWHYDPKLESWEYNDRAKWQGAVAVLASLAGTLCLGGIIAAIVLLKRRRKVVKSREYETLSGVSTENEEVNISM